MKKTLIFLLLTWMSTEAFSQAKVLRSYTPSSTAAPAPVTYDTGTPAPVSLGSPSDQDSRRAAALAKVQGRPVSTADAKGLSPAQYSTDGMSPAMYSTMPDPDPATTVTVNGVNVRRNVRKGSGQVGNELFTPVSELHFVQFAVYCKDTPVDKAPAIDGLYLLWHPGSTCPGGEQGASYIVKGYNSPEEAKAAVAAYKAAKIDCWYNPALTGAEVEIIGVR